LILHMRQQQPGSSNNSWRNKHSSQVKFYIQYAE
jgi:hypothetical protein